MDVLDKDSVQQHETAFFDKEDQRDTTHGAIKVDHHGLPLIPQPSDSPGDPLNWSRSRKYSIVAQCALLAFFSNFALAVANPAYAQIAVALRIPVTNASYIGTSAIAAAGIGALIYVPLSNVYGRRPCLLFGQALAAIAGIGSAVASKYTGIIVGRVFVGLGGAANNVLTVSVISDIFCMHERGTWIGIVTVALINGPHVASLPGGFIAQYVGWRWTLWLPAIISGAIWILILFCLPETLYVRDTAQGYPESANPVRQRLRPWGIKHPGRKLHAMAFARPFQMLYYYPVAIVALYSACAFTLGSVGPAQTVSALFKKYYHWQSGRTGLALSLSTTIGGVLGEIMGGPVADRLLSKSRQQLGRVVPEARLKAAIPGAIILPSGLIIFGFCIKHYDLHASYVGACVGMALTCFAVQTVISPLIAYSVDCYKSQAGEVVLLLNAGRQLLSFTVGFWSLRYGEEVGFHLSGVTYAAVSVAFFIPVLLLIRYGETWRQKLGQPNFNKGI